MRHNRLESPFDNYDKLKYSDLVWLANGSISPRISPNIENKKNIDILWNKNFVIYTSTEVRTQDTARLIWCTSFIACPELNELKFPIQELLSESEYKKGWMEAVRKVVLKYFLQEEIQILIRDKLNYIKQIITDNTNIVIITHGFYMRFLYLIFKEWKILNEIDLEILSRAPNFGYMDGFTL